MTLPWEFFTLVKEGYLEKYVVLTHISDSSPYCSIRNPAHFKKVWRKHWCTFSSFLHNNHGIMVHIYFPLSDLSAILANRSLYGSSILSFLNFFYRCISSMTSWDSIKIHKVSSTSISIYSYFSSPLLLAPGFIHTLGSS